MNRPEGLDMVAEAWRSAVKNGTTATFSASFAVKLFDYIDELEAERAALPDVINGLGEALDFYGDPDTWFAVAILADPPCGEINDDWSEHGSPEYDEGDQRPGRRAREALAKARVALGHVQPEEKPKVTCRVCNGSGRDPELEALERLGAVLSMRCGECNGEGVV